VANELRNRYGAVDVSGYPDVHLLTDDLDVALWVLLVGSEKLEIESLTAAEIAEVATHTFRRGLTRQRAASSLRLERKLVTRTPGTTPTRFIILRAGIDRVKGHQTDVVVVDPVNAFTALRRLDAILSCVKGEAKMCDPYIDDKTLLALTSVPTTVKIKLLTLNVSDPSQFRRRFQAYHKEYGNLEIRVSSSTDLHDRYLIDQSQMWLLGQSLNGIGKKQSFIVAMGQDTRAAMDRAFTERWNRANAWT